MNSYDILVLGATGFTGKLITRYLYAHPQFRRNAEPDHQTFTFAIGARSQSRLNELVKDVNLDTELVKSVVVDVTVSEDVSRAVKAAKVVINTVGPYWRWGTPVVKACVEHGVHYVDLTGEPVWVRDIISQFDFTASKTKAIIVPSCGMDSIPSDYSAYLSYMALSKLPSTPELRSSTSAYKIRGGVSGGTLSTMMTMLEEVPAEKLKVSGKPYALSPVKPAQLQRTPSKLLYRMPHLSHVVGGYFFMSSANKALVQRTWGLLEYQALTKPSHAAPRYGPAFVYDEFMQTPGVLSALSMSMGLFTVGLCLYLFAPVRWLFKRYMTQPGDGPSEESMQKGFIKVTNVTTAVSPSSSKPIVVKSEFKGNGDPGYLLTSIMISESALSILLSHDKLPALAQAGGVLTPVTAFGDVLIERLMGSSRFEFTSHIIHDGEGSSKKHD